MRRTTSLRARGAGQSQLLNQRSRGAVLLPEILTFAVASNDALSYAQGSLRDSVVDFQNFIFMTYYLLTIFTQPSQAHYKR